MASSLDGNPLALSGYSQSLAVPRVKPRGKEKGLSPSKLATPLSFWRDASNGCLDVTSWWAVIRFKKERVMRGIERGWYRGWVLMLLGIFLLATGASSRAQETCSLGGQVPHILQGFEIAPVPLDLIDKNPLLVGLGSYIVNAQGACNDCHTAPLGRHFRPADGPHL